MAGPYAPPPAEPAAAVVPVAGAPAKKGWLRAFGARVFVLLVGLIVALGLAEIALRIFGHEGPVYTIRDPVIGRRYTRSWEGDCYIEEADRVVHLRFNREGMRDRDWSEERAPHTVRIAILGDSMVAALGVPEEKTFAKLLEARLQADENAKASREPRTARTYEVMNWGV